MKIVIDIPEEVIESAKSSPNYYPAYHFEKIWRAIVNSIPYECDAKYGKLLKQAQSDDAIDRKLVCAFIDGLISDDGERKKGLEYIRNMPPVNPTKTAKWILIDKELSRYKCSECGEVIKLYKKSEISKLEKDETLSDYPFSHCGARMVEPQESERTV